MTDPLEGRPFNVQQSWAITEAGMVDLLTDDEVQALWDWIEEREIALPPALWVADQMAERKLIR